MGASYYTGTSGWHYPHWQIRFYPATLSRVAWLGHCAQHCATVETKGSSCFPPLRTAARAWKNATPPAFVSVIKASRYFPHRKKRRAVPPAAGQRIVVTPC